MKRDFISVLKYNELIELMLSAEKLIILSAVSLHDDLAIPLIEAYKRDVAVNVVIDIDEDNIRNGFGEISSVEKLEENGVKVDQVDGNLISFIIVDDVGYFLFQQSKQFLEDTKGPNAVLMDDIIRTKLIAFYYQPEHEDDFLVKDVASNIDITKSLEELNDLDYLSYQSSLIIKDLDHHRLEGIKKNLKLNPPLQPDLKRRINTYTTKVQFVELRFIKSNFSTKKIPLPKDALPFRDAKLKNAIESKLNLFENLDDNKDFKNFREIKDEEEVIRGKYLVPVKCRKKSLLKVIEKENFLANLMSIQEKIKKYKNAGLQELERAMLNRKNVIKKELTEFLRVNPPSEYSNYDESLLFDKLDDDIQKIVSRLKFPSAKSLITGLEIKYNFYDLTFEDFRDEELIEEFREKEILKSEELDDIVSIKEAFEATKDERTQVGLFDEI